MRYGTRLRQTELAGLGPLRTTLVDRLLSQQYHLQRASGFYGSASRWAKAGHRTVEDGRLPEFKKKCRQMDACKTARPHPSHAVIGAAMLEKAIWGMQFAKNIWPALRLLWKPSHTIAHYFNFEVSDFHRPNMPPPILLAGVDFCSSLREATPDF